MWCLASSDLEFKGVEPLRSHAKGSIAARAWQGFDTCLFGLLGQVVQQSVRVLLDQARHSLTL